MLQITRVGLWIGLISILVVVISCVSGAGDAVFAADNETRTITGLVQNQDFRWVDQAIVQVRDQEGNVVTQGVTNQAGIHRDGPARGHVFRQFGSGYL